ncbi:DUF4062 domain-containing protein [Burkholderia sp. Ax-1724]|uniref:DUF4062 domain-containing protein n=1 Tax=Burkholderia sp. Ax-1724 TaxID=2608336 RepID=UPI00141E3855|nr:DUF4062 domain-containing protein [Burkholderia sp. Ax-1724]
MEKRYQVFVSSTFKDLEDERQEVMHALLELDCIPSGMELFPAANETQWNLIKKLIDDCDYYILIVAGRYGSIGSEGISYTEMEYRYAIERGKPTIAFLHRDPGKIIADKTESSTEGKEKLRTFRASVEQRLCKHWDTPHELGSVVSRSLFQLIRSTPAVGWVRADTLATAEATAELLKLRRMVDELQSELARVRTPAPKGTDALGDEFPAPMFTRYSDWVGNDRHLNEPRSDLLLTDKPMFVGDTAWFEVEVDSIYSPDEYTIVWRISGLEVAQGPVFRLTLEPKHVGQPFGLQVDITSNKEWHRIASRFDAVLTLRYEVRPIPRPR